MKSYFISDYFNYISRFDRKPKKFVEGRWKKVPDFNKIIRTVTIEGVNIPVLSLHYEAEAYMKLGRKNKVDMIYKYIKNVH